MSRRPSTFRQRDLTAAVKGARAAGCTVARVEVGKDGKIIVIVSDGKDQPINEINDNNHVNEWDDL
jgi:hypothetical protein